MNHFFKRISWKDLLSPAGFILTGLLLSIWPQSSIKIICTAASIFMFALGAICLYFYFSGKEDYLAGRLNLLCGVFVIAIAIWIITRSNYFLSLLPFLAGVTVMVHGLSDLKQAFMLRMAKNPHWWITLTIALAAICLGFVMLIDPFETLVNILRFIGIVLIAVGVSDLYVLFQGLQLPAAKRSHRSAQKRTSDLEQKSHSRQRSVKKKVSLPKRETNMQSDDSFPDLFDTPSQPTAATKEEVQTEPSFDEEEDFWDDEEWDNL